MPHSDDFGIDDDDSAFIAAATQIEASQYAGEFSVSPRPSKRRRLGHHDGASSDESNFPLTDDETGANSQATYSISGTPNKISATSDREQRSGLDSEFDVLEAISQDDKSKKQSKHKIHIPKNVAQYEDIFVTQTQAGLDADLGQFRGAIWKKPAPAAPKFDAPPRLSNRTSLSNVSWEGVKGRQVGAGLPRGQSMISGMFKRAETDEQMAARLQAEENDLGLNRPLAEESIYSLGTKQSFDASNELEDLPSDAFASSSSPEKSPAKDVVTITSSLPIESPRRPTGIRAPITGLKQMTMFGQPATQSLSASQATKKKHAWPLKARDEPPTQHKLDPEAMKTWVYPTNLGTIRDYQFNIVSRCLLHNTLVALPTGLGKTFIAATVMLNYFRWTKDAQIVFMAPTKPLIAQQMDACYHIVGIPRRETVLMTGETSPGIRSEEWLEKRVFFMTPQTVINDLKTGICDPKKLVLLVVDEAHKATGGYAYTEVISFVRRFNSSCRVLALTATPGSKVEAVQAVVDNLDIARVELRTEQSLDIRPYTHEKHTETELFDYSDEQSLVMEHMSKALKPTLEKLNTQNAYWSKDPMQLTAFGLTQARGKWASSEAGRKAPMPVKGMVQGAFAVLSSLAHSIGLLKFHGIGPFYSGIAAFQRNIDSGQTKGKTATGIAQSSDFVKMTGLIRGWTNNPDFIGHPKLEYLRQVVLNHFLDAGDGQQGSDVPPSATRVMVFASYRDSTDEICRVLKRNEPMIRPHVFVGQAGKDGSEGMNQKKQNQVVQDFKSGKYNTLVATSIGEEGLDIGDVDLIVCYDASSSPIRMLQRIGRTGRKRVGRVVLLLMRGKEENDYAKAQDNYAYIQKTIADDSKYNYHDDRSPRILPKEVQPVVDKRAIEIPVENSQPVDLNESGRRARGKGKVKRPPKKFHMPDGVITGFVKASKIGSDAEESDEKPAPKKRAPAKATKPSAVVKNIRSAPDIAQLPFIKDVLLDSTQKMELERKYAQTTGDDADLIIRAPSTSRFPLALANLSNTKYANHGRVAGLVSKAMQMMRKIDDTMVEQIEKGLQDQYLQNFGSSRLRLVNPEPHHPLNDGDLPSIPLLLNRTKSKIEPRRRKRANESCTNVSQATTNQKKTAVKLPKRKPNQSLISDGFAADEGEESSPEPTPANLRIGTQGIDLGSQDTSGEDEDEEADSDLDSFVARSDDPIELASSSQQLSQELTQHHRRGKPSKRGLQTKHALSEAYVVDSDDGEEFTGAEDQVKNAGAANTMGRRRRVVDESDEDE